MSRIQKKNATPIGNLIQYYIKVNGLGAGINTRIIYDAWDEVSGAAQFTVKKYYREGKLYITLSSSVARTQLSFQKNLLIEKINARIQHNELFSKDDKFVGNVKELILK